MTRQVSTGSSDKPPSPGRVNFRPVYTAGYIPDISPQVYLGFIHGKLMLQNKHKNKFDRLCSGLRIFVNRYLIILKSLLFPPSEKSGSTDQLHNQFADIGLSPRNIVKNNSFDSAPKSGLRNMGLKILI